MAKNLTNPLTLNETIAYGAAAQAAILSDNTSEKTQDLLVLDIIMLLSFSIKTLE
ncbi:9372_t:CDS:1, partial [Gigaspora margarita]